MCTIMTVRSRGFSLDGSESMDLGRGRSSSSRFSSKNRRDYGTLNETLQELNHNLNSSISHRNQTIAVESIGHSDSLTHKTSFLKHRKSFYKHFQEVPAGESLLHTFTCALQKEVLYQGRLFVSENHVCFYSSVLLKDTKVVIPASSVMEVKKHSSALSVLSILTADGEKYSFMSMRRLEVCYRLLQAVCCQVQKREKSINSSPHLSSADNEGDHDMASSFSSLEDSVDRDLSRQNSVHRDSSFISSSEGPTRRSSTRQNSLTDEDNGDRSESSIWRMAETVAPLFFLRELRSLSVLFYVYMMLLVLLLLASGYIGLRMVALEEQLVEMSMQHSKYPQM
ncbi:GRAM domain-containing protein 2B-like isoform X2 [Pungitius pungitius]|uniref:GRAM domain-containing protein 2B-like isoform X2 n=1 Tax=Pungitius pungitius TaxID=134920 RepID=UPI002E14B312